MTRRSTRRLVPADGSRRCGAWLLVAGTLVASALTVACAPSGRQAADAPAAAAPQGDATVPDRPAALPPRDRLSATDRDRWRQVLHWPAECEDAFQASHAGDDSGLQFHELGPGLSIVEVLCAAGSYQASSMFIKFDERPSPPGVTTLRFATYENSDGRAFVSGETAEVWGEAAIDVRAQAMTVLNLARQTADCGTWVRYDLAGAQPTVTDARARLPCPTRPRAPVSLDGTRPPAGWPPIILKR